MTVPAIELKGISKSFGPVQANKDISISVAPGTIHGIIGENGAGKSTLMSILYGFYKADKGEIWINGSKTEIPDSQAAIAAGIGMVFQHFKLVENFTVLENIILGAEDGGLLKPSLAKARKLLTDLAHEYELDVNPDAVICGVRSVIGLIVTVRLCTAESARISAFELFATTWMGSVGCRPHFPKERSMVCPRKPPVKGSPMKRFAGVPPIWPSRL